MPDVTVPNILPSSPVLTETTQIKSVGETEVELRLHADVKSTLKVRVESSNPPAEKSDAAVVEAPRTQTRAKRGEQQVYTSERVGNAARPERKPRAKSDKA